MARRSSNRAAPGRWFVTSIQPLLANLDNTIMSHDDSIAVRQRREQERVFRLCQRDGMTLKAIALDSGLGYTTVQTYAHGEAVMSIASLFRLIGVVPDEYLSLLLPEGRQIVRAPDEIDHDALAEMAEDYVSAKMAAHHPLSEAGRELGPNELTALDGKVTALRAVA